MKPNTCCYLILSLVLPLTVGCQSPGKIDYSQHGVVEQDFDPDFLNLVTPAFFELPRVPDQVALSSLGMGIESADHDLMSTNSNNGSFYAVFFTILSMPVVEKPEYWVNVINDTNRSDLLRLYCFRAFFLRHVKAGDGLDKLAQMPGTESWFNEDTIHLVGGLGGATRFDLEDDADQVEIRMRSDVVGAGIPITLAVTGSTITGPDSYTLKRAEVLDVLRGRRKNPNLVITGVAVY